MRYSFAEKLEYTQGVQAATEAETIMDMLPNCVSVIKTDIETDKSGIDYIATLEGGAEIYIDAKTREAGASKWWRAGPEVALELWSVCPGGKYRVPPERAVKGWTLCTKKNTDMILYTFHREDSERCYLIPYQLLRKAFIENMDEWCNRYKVAYQESDGWQSQCVFVPVHVVLSALITASIGETSYN